MKSLNVGTFSRSGRIAKAGMITGGNYLRHYLGNSLPIKKLHQDKKTLNRKNAISIFRELSQLKGLPLKLAQGMSMDTGLLPIEFMEVMSSAQYSVPPMNRALVRTQFKRNFNEYPENLFQSFEYDAFAAATIGQVHHAINTDGVRVVVKVQYPNVRKSIYSDIKLLSIFGKQFFKGVNFEIYLDEVRETLLEETDYLKEGRNIQKFRDLNFSEELIFPEYKESTSNEQVLTMTFLEGDHLDQMLKKEPNQKIRNSYGQIMWNFFHANIYSTNNTFHADVHPGNFIFCKGGKLGVIDFGCVKVFPDQFIKSCIRLVQKHLNNLFQNTMEIREVRGSEQFIFFNRITFGLMSILMKLEAQIETGKAKEIILSSDC